MKIYFTPSLLLESFKLFVGVFLKKFRKFSHKMVSRFFQSPSIYVRKLSLHLCFLTIFLSYNCYYEKYSDGSVKNIQDEIPFDLPEGWAWGRISSIGTTNIGLTYKPTDIVSNGTIVLRSSNIKNNQIDLSDLVRVRTIVRENQLVERNDIVICARNGSKALVGKSAIFNMNLGENVSFGAFMAILRTDCYNYVYYFLNTNQFRQVLNSDDTKQINQLTQDMLKRTIIPIPPQDEQERIVFILNQITTQITLINDNYADIDILQQTIQKKILELAIQGKLVPQDENDEPASVLLERIRAERKAKLGKKYVESYIFKGDDNCYYEKVGSLTKNITAEIPFDIPNSWSWIRLSNITTLITKGTTPRGDAYTYTNSGIGFLRAENIVGFDKISKKDLKYINETTHYNFLKRSILEENDILITIAGTLGRTGMVTKEDLPLNANQAVSIVRVVNGYKIDLLYLIFVLNAPIIKKYLLSKSVEMAIPNLSLENISDCVIPLPPIQEQYNITKKISQLLDILKGGD